MQKKASRESKICDVPNTLELSDAAPKLSEHVLIGRYCWIYKRAWVCALSDVLKIPDIE